MCWNVLDYISDFIKCCSQKTVKHTFIRIALLERIDIGVLQWHDMNIHKSPVTGGSSIETDFQKTSSCIHVGDAWITYIRPVVPYTSMDI